MKKNWMLVLVLVLTVCLLGGCAALPLTGLTDLANMRASAASGFSDTVTISREEYERYRRLDDVLDLLEIVEYYYYKEPDSKDLLQGACAGLLAGLDDPYSYYYTPEQWAKEEEDDKGEYAGVGILISANYNTGKCTISRVFKGSPAEAAGVQRRDILYRVGEDLYVTPETLQDAVDIMRGTPGTSVDVTFLRNGEEITFTLDRAIINVNRVESCMLTEDVGLIAMYEFAGKCDEEFEAALNSLVSEGMQGLIIDLRDNPGGWVDAAQHIADLFLDKGDLCTLQYREGEPEHPYPTRDGKLDIPLVLLVNENSASASEILMAALRERAGATAVGVTTYGKGVVQAVLPIGSDGAAFQMTIAQYMTPDGNFVTKDGLVPDVEIPLEEGDIGDYDFGDKENDPQLKKALEVMIEKMNAPAEETPAEAEPAEEVPAEGNAA